MNDHILPTEGEEGNAPSRDPRKCSHVRDDGSHCEGWKAKGTDLCAGHLGVGVAADPREAASRSAEVRNRKAEARSEAREAMKLGLEARTQAFLERDDVRGKLETRWLSILETGTDADVIRLHKELTDRAYGTAVQRTKDETHEEAEDVVAIRRMSPAERHAWIVREQARRREAEAS